MTQDNWQDCPTMKSVVEAMERGDDVQTDHGSGTWSLWETTKWEDGWEFRCRPAKKTKTVVMRECLYSVDGVFYYSWSNLAASDKYGFIRYTGNERTEEVPE